YHGPSRPVRASAQGCGRVAEVVQSLCERALRRPPRLCSARRRLVGLPPVTTSDRERRTRHDGAVEPRGTGPLVVASAPSAKPPTRRARAPRSGWRVRVRATYLGFEFLDHDWWLALKGLVAALDRSDAGGLVDTDAATGPEADIGSAYRRLAGVIAAARQPDLATLAASALLDHPVP